MSVEAKWVDEAKVRQDMWQGSVPVVFQLSANEITTLEAPPPLYMLLPRMSYLPLVSAAARSHFFSSAPPVEDEMWFEYDGFPLKWNIPIGVLFDLFGGRRHMPWPLTVHFQRFPEKKLLRCRNQDAVKFHFVNSFKEAMFLRYGSAKAVTNLSRAEQSQLWDSVGANSYAPYWSVMEVIERENGSSYPQSLPVRLLIQSQEIDQRFVQLPITAFIDNNESQPQTVLSALARLSPPLHRYFLCQFAPSSSEPISLDSFESPSLEEEVGIELTGSEYLEVLVQGLKIPLSTPLLWLASHLSHPDHFLYICVVKNSL
eukprot:TRINITY_DN1549_c0_g3_i1.p1 TRINITY_DN1549_c0_g3~~TRINITY_DN1549_c0_g3_i1.p1  ORF type:complete len:350 (+),score=69.97 TRINITY_DN1549_c0_g3_i1:106-1050(+)